MDSIENENIEIQLLLKAIYLKYGYDFRSYAGASIKRRIKRNLKNTGLETISDMQRCILYDRDFFSSFLREIPVNVTGMFRNVDFYKALREVIIPKIANLPFIKIWHAGCATGEEVYSMAILLKEAGIYYKTQIYATDFDEEALGKAKTGVYSIDRLKSYTQKYKESGGLESFGDYYSAKYEFALMDKSLKKNILFSNHNLATDNVFGKMDMILCRNVLIYFNRELQNRVLGLFKESLYQNGFLCLGVKETMILSEYSGEFETVIKDQKIYRKKIIIRK